MKTRYFVVVRFHGGCATWYSYTTEAKARAQFNMLRGECSYRCLSYGLGNIIEERGRP